MLDVDNTLTAHGSQHLAPHVEHWLQQMRQAGVEMRICSNNFEKRVRPFAEKIGLPFVSFSLKPASRGLRLARRAFGLRKKEIALVGDQIFTDVLAAKLYGMGARVVLAEVQRQKGQLAQQIIRGEFGANAATFYEVDLAKEAQVRALAEWVLAQYGVPDVIFNNATITKMGAVDEVETAFWDYSYAVNLKAPLLLAQLFLPQMKARGGGVLVFVSSSGASPYMTGTYQGDGSENLHNIMLYQSMSGDAGEGTASFQMTGGSITANSGDLFYVTNTDAVILLSGVDLTLANNNLLTVAGNSSSRGWGTAGANGAQVAFTAADMWVSASRFSVSASMSPAGLAKPQCASSITLAPSPSIDASTGRPAAQ